MNLPEVNDRPPVFKSWSGWYWLLATVTLTQLAIYMYLTLSLNHSF